MFLTALWLNDSHESLVMTHWGIAGGSNLCDRPKPVAAQGIERVFY